MTGKGQVLSSTKIASIALPCENDHFVEIELGLENRYIDSIIIAEIDDLELMIETILRLIWEWEFATGAVEISKTKNFQISKVGRVEDAPKGAIVDRALAQVEVFKGGQVFALSDKFYLIRIGNTATQIESRQKKELIHKFDINPQWQF